jgi:hypothetical protein
MMQRNKRIGLLLLTFIFGVHAAWAGAQTKAAFEKLKSLSGEWEGKDADGMDAKTSFKVIVNGTTVMETLVAMHMEEMVTLYNVDGDSISLIHYCPTNNQPRMRATPGDGAIKELSFSFQGAGNLPSEATGHEHKLVIRFEDNDHITEEWTWRKNGKDTPMIYHFARKKS